MEDVILRSIYSAFALGCVALTVSVLLIETAWGWVQHGFVIGLALIFGSIAAMLLYGIWTYPIG